MYVEREIAYTMENAKAETMVVYEQFYPRVQAVREEAGIKRVIVASFGPLQAALDGQSVHFDRFLQTDHPVPSFTIDPNEDVAVLQYTGGTTGRSKGVMLTHRNLVANIYQLEPSIRLSAPEPGVMERTLTVIPLFHVYGMTVCMNMTILLAGTMILLPRFELEEVLVTIRDKKPTLFPGVPTMYIAINNHPRAEAYGISSIRLCNSGSAPMPLEAMKSFEAKTGASLLEGYGLSETSPTTHSNPVGGVKKPGSVGIPIPSTDCKIVDLATGTKELPPGEEGEIIIKGPQVMKGYWRMPEETRLALRDGWLYTGDIGRMDEDGYLYIIDRKKDLIIAGGYNVFPRDVEEVLYQHPAVLEAAVVGVPDEYRGETVKAFIVPKPGSHLTAEEVEQHCRKNLAAYKVPRIIEFREALPKSAVGKILRRELKNT